MKRQFEPATIFATLLDETRTLGESDEERAEYASFEVSTPDSTPELFADELISRHYPAQSELPLV